MPRPISEGSPPDGAPDDVLPDLGHPVRVFIDTSFFEAQNFAFGGRLLQALVAGVAAGDICFVVSEITRREVQAHLAAGVEAAKAALGKFRRDAKILKGLPAHALSTVFKDTDWAETKAELDREWDGFLKTAKAEVLPIDGSAAAGVFDDYFTRKAPFGGSEKKSEFPDAFVIKALRAFGTAQGCKVIVISNDNDFRSGCEGDPVLVFCPDLNKVLEHSTRFRPLNTEVNPAAIHELLTKHRELIDAAIVQSFQACGFYWDSDEGYDSEVDDTYDVEVESLDVAVIDVTDEWAEVAGNATIHFRASARYPDPDMGYKDDESKKWVSLGRVCATLSATVTVPVAFTLNAEKLKTGVLEHDKLDVNGHADVWFSEDEIEEIRKPDSGE